MKNVLKTIGAAMLGGFLSLAIWRMADFQNPEVRVEPAPAFKAVNAGYAMRTPAEGVNFDFTAAAQAATPSVVHILSTVRASAGDQQLELPDIFKDFFGDQFQRQGPVEPQPRVGSGSGVIISPDGYIVTNNHVVTGASKLEVTLSDNRTFDAQVIGTDPNTDLALIKIDVQHLPSIPIGNSDEAKVGEWVLAIGNPFNLESTVTAGIISAKGRNINILEDRAAIESFIQTDAAINPGNSGGALVDLGGNLIGINTAIATPTGSYAGYGFAVPSNLMKKVVEDLKAYGKVQRAFLGVTIRNLDSKLMKEKHLTVSEGAYVDSLAENGAAKKAGIKSGDVIVRLDQTPIRTSAELQEAIARHSPGDQVNVAVLRDGKEKIIGVGLKNLSGNTEVVKAYTDDVLRGIGADFENVPKKEKESLGLGNKGVRVADLRPGALTSQTTIHKGFIVTEVNRHEVDNVEDVIRELKKSDEGVMIKGVYPEDPSTVVFYAFGLSS